jgi:hypothetical protein
MQISSCMHPPPLPSTPTCAALTTIAISVSMSVLPILCISRTCSWILAPWPHTTNCACSSVPGTYFSSSLTGPQVLKLTKRDLAVLGPSCMRIHFTWATRIPRGFFALGRPNVTACCHTSVLATAHFLRQLKAAPIRTCATTSFSPALPTPLTLVVNVNRGTRSIQQRTKECCLAPRLSSAQ